MTSEVNRINASVEQFRSNESFESVQSDLVEIETKLKSVRERQKALRYDIQQLEKLPQPEHISENEIGLLFNQFKHRLGDMINKSLEEVKQLRGKIDLKVNPYFLFGDRPQALQKGMLEPDIIVQSNR